MPLPPRRPPATRRQRAGLRTTTRGPHADAVAGSASAPPGRAPARPRSRQPLLEIPEQPVDREPILLHRIALPHRHLAILQRVEVDGHAEGRPDLVLPAVPPSDGTGVVVR